MRSVIAVVALAALASPVRARQPQQTFTASTDVAAVEVSVLDANGNPVPDLAITDFDVTVSGRRRVIQSAQFIRTEPGSAPPPARESGVSTNQLPTSGRLLLLVMDESNLRPGGTVPVIRAAEALLQRLSPGDFVGVARIPDGGGVEFTHDRTRVIAALRDIKGRPPRPRRSRVTVHISEAADYADTQRLQWPAALKRECGEPNSFGYSLCVGAMQTEAQEILRDEELKLTTFTSTIRRLIEAAGAARMPVTMVVISESLFVGRDAGALSGLAATAAFARVSLNVVRPLTSAFDAATTTLSSDPAADNDLRRHGLERLAAEFRGGFYEVSATGAVVFDRISRELSGYYLLGIELTDDDRRSRARPLRVTVRRPGVVVRARAAFWAPPVTSTPTNHAERLKEMLRAPAPTRGLPLKLTSRTIGEGTGDRLRLLIAAEVGTEIETSATYHVGLLVVGPKGDHIASTAGTLHLAPARPGRRSPALFTTSLVVDPGDYNVRVAAIAADGQSGSVHHIAPAALSKLGHGFSASEIILSAEPPPQTFPQFTPSSIVDGPRAAVVMELRHDDAKELDTASVRFEVAGQSFEAVAPPATANRRVFSRIFDLELTTGDYEMRAVVTPSTGEPFTVVRTFRFQP